MALQIVGAGFGRTGTASMRSALERLGFGPCHHMSAVIGDTRQVAYWEAAGAGETMDWDQVFDGFAAAVDWPSCTFWREIAERYPDAKVLLTTRSAESWWNSISKTIFPLLRDDEEPADPLRRCLRHMTRRVIAERQFAGNVTDKEHAIRVYEAHNAAVEAAIPQGRRLTYRLGEGWEPLCRWLGVPVPAEPFPKGNSTEEFQERNRVQTT